MRFLLMVGLALFVSIGTGVTAADNGLVSVKSPHTVQETADRLENILKAKGMTIFNRINHGEGAAKVGVDLRPTQLLIFGNPKVGAPLMKCAQSVGIDLPMKALIWQDSAGQVWLSYNAAGYLIERHTIAGCEVVEEKIQNALRNFAAAATQP